jgi:signal transduction histidine kinase
MKRGATVLLLEDDPADAVLVERALARSLPDVAVDHVGDLTGFLARLTAGGFDLVISDGSVSGCEGLRAFHLAREWCPAVPFLLLSGADDPQRDVPGLQALGVGALLSKENLDALAPAVVRALAEPERARTPDARLSAGYQRLVGVVKQLSQSPDLPAIMAVVRRAARELTGADGATFVLRDGDQCFYADEDAIGPLWKGQRFPMHSCISGWAMLHRQPAVVENIFADARIPVSAYQPTFVRSVVMVPIRALDPIGAIGTYWAVQRRPDGAEVRLLQALADTTSVALENVRVHRELEARVRERTADLESFTYAVSHDLRAPIRHVQGYAALLAEDLPADLPADAQRDLSRITASAQRMSQMVEALLTLSRTSRAPVHREPVDLARLAREVAAECDLGTTRPVRFVVPETLPATGDPVLLRLALENLLGNAWKFSSKADAPEVELGVHHGSGNETVYFVRDNGAGFDETAAGRLFGVFQRLHAQEEFPGTGVGLATVQRIVRKHGGRIWGSGAPGRGATFSFTLQPAAGEGTLSAPG